MQCSNEHLYSITSSARGEQRWRHIKAERLRGLEVDDNLEFRGLLDRNIGALENPVHEHGCPAKGGKKIHTP